MENQALFSLPAKKVRTWQRVALAAWLAVAAGICCYYFRQVYKIFQLGPLGWLKDNSSFFFLGAARRFITGQEALHFPYAGPALASALAALTGALAVLLAVTVLGAALLAWLKVPAGDPGERLLLSYGLGAGGLAFLSLALAYAGLYTVSAVRILVLALLAVGAVWGGVRLWGRRQAGLPGMAFQRPRPRGWDRVWLAVVGVTLAMALIGALAPETGYDALWYHLWLPKMWLQAGHPVDPIEEYISLYPLNEELLFGAGLALNGPVAAKLLHAATLPLLALLIFQAGRRYFPRSSPYLAAALFVTAPTVLWEATTADVDLAVTLMAGLAFYTLLRYLETHQRSWLVASGLIFGFALGTKHLALVLLPLYTGLLALVLWRQGRSWRQVLGTAAPLCALIVLLGAPWYVRNFLASGNPVFPDLYRFFGARPAGRWDAVAQAVFEAFENHFGRPRTLPNTLTLPLDILFHAQRYGGTFGPALFIGLLGLAWRQARNMMVPASLLICGLYFAYWASPLGYFELRFLIPILPLVALLAADGSARVLQAAGAAFSPAAARWLLAGLALLICLNLPPFISIHEGDRVVWSGWLSNVVYDLPLGVVTGYESPDDYLAKNVYSYPAWQWINAHLPAAGVRILMLGGGDQFYAERPRLWIDAPLARPADVNKGPGQDIQALTGLKSLGITHLLLEKRLMTSARYQDLAFVQAGFRDQHLLVLYEDWYFILYQVR